MSLVRFRLWAYGALAQSVEHLTFNQVVRGSNPRTLTLDKQYCLSILLSEDLQNKAGLMYADVAELADAPDLGSGAARRGGSSPFTRTKKQKEKLSAFFYFSPLLFPFSNHFFTKLPT